MLVLKLFGEIEATADGGRIDLAGAKLAALLAILAASPKPVPRESLAEMLWGSHFEEQARQNLRQALARLKKQVGEAIAADDRVVRLRREVVTSDVARFMVLSTSEDAEALREAAELAREDFLAGISVREAGFSDWLAAERQAIAARLRDVERRLARMALDAGDAPAALERSTAMLARDGFDEEAHRMRLSALAAQGRKAEALKAHQHFAERLRAELGTEPEEPTRRLVEQLKAPGAPAGAEAAPARPSLLVLPFAAMGGEPDQEDFAEGMVDELITALSRLHWLSVLSRSSTFSSRAAGLDARAAGEAFGVRYVLEGSIRRAGPALRISGQLIETASGAALWAERFDGGLADLFDLQDQVAAKVVGALQPRLERAEIARAQRKPTDSLDAYDHYLRGLAEVHRWTREANGAALRHFSRAIELDPNFAAAYGMAARCYSQRRSSGWVEDLEGERSETERLASRAAALGYDDPVALSSAGIALAFVAGRVREGRELIARALLLNPGLATALLYNGWVNAWAGDADAAIASIERAIELSPHDPNIPSMRRAIGFAHFIAGRHAEALTCVEAVATASQNAGIGSATRAASLEILGRHAEAEAEMARLLVSEPRLTLASLRTRFPLVKDADFERLSGALARAGLPRGDG